MKTKIINDRDINADDKQENIEEKDKKNIDLPMADIFSHAVAIMRMRLRE